MSSNGERAGVRGCAFGLAVEADFPIDGLGAPRDDAGLPEVALHVSDEAAIAKVWRSSETIRIAEERAGDDGGHPDRTIDVHPELGYRLYARYFGLCVISPDGSRVLCAPPPVPSWRWQRFLTGRGLPIASLLRGYEVLHAGAVAIDGGVVAIVGPTGAGKTSLTLQLVMRGARFFTDDVLALELPDEGLLAHPGIGVANLRAGERERLGPAIGEMLGELLGRTGRGKLHYAMPTAPEPLPPRALYFLERGSERGVATIRPLPAPDPLELLASTFITEIRAREQLASLLDVCGRLAALVPMFVVSRGAEEDASALAERLRAHVAAEVPV